MVIVDVLVVVIDVLKVEFVEVFVVYPGLVLVVVVLHHLSLERW
jgi:hypothetical protein